MVRHLIAIGVCVLSMSIIAFSEDTHTLSSAKFHQETGSLDLALLSLLTRLLLNLW